MIFLSVTHLKQKDQKAKEEKVNINKKITGVT